MKTVNDLICIVLTFMCISCVKTEGTDIPSVKIDFTNISHIGQTEGTIVNLETSDSSLLYDICRFNVVRDTFVVHSRNFVRLFSKTGKFIGDVSQTGPGPNEYTQISNIFFENDEVGIFESNKNTVKWFNLSGGLSASREVAISDINIRPFHLYPSGNGYVALNNYGGESADRKTLCFLNKELNQGESIEGRSLRTGFSTYDDIYIDRSGKVLYWEMLCDTLFMVDNSTLVPSFVVDFGEYAIPEDIASKDVYERINYVNELDKSGKKFAGMARYYQRIDNKVYFSCMSPEKEILLCQYIENEGAIRLFAIDFDSEKYKTSSCFLFRDNVIYWEIHDQKDLTLNPSLFILDLNELK